jgi:tripeptide aminopeptidase
MPRLRSEVRVARLVDESAALKTVMGLLAIEGVTAHEGAVARRVRAELAACGVAAARIRVDAANRRFGFAAESGNLIARVPGTGAATRARPRLFSAHMDTVELASGARAVRKGNRVVPRGATALGADDRAGVAVVLSMLRTLARRKLEHPPLVILFTVCEESGLWGSRFVDPRVVAACEVGFNFDGSSPAELVVAAPSQDRLTIEIDGIASHAGIAPEKGASATIAFAEATARLARGGWLGRVRKGANVGTSNIGVVKGGIATNITTPHVSAEGEARSYSDAFLGRMVGAFRSEFTAAARRTKNASGASARASVGVSRLYQTFDLAENSPAVREAARAARSVGLEPSYKRQFGGLDANWLNAHGLPTVTLGAGGHNAHGTNEYLDIGEFVCACEMAVRMSGARVG